MSGYCPSCGNTLCICDELDPQPATDPGKTYDWSDVPAKAQAPREFWIADKPNGSGTHVFHSESVAKGYCEDNDIFNGPDHVIEYAAYEALERELAEAKAGNIAHQKSYDHAVKKYSSVCKDLGIAKNRIEELEFNKIPLDYKEALDQARAEIASQDELRKMIESNRDQLRIDKAALVEALRLLEGETLKMNIHALTIYIQNILAKWSVK